MAYFVDLRDRYFAFAVPFVWITVVSGAFGNLPLTLRLHRVRRLFETVRLALFVMVLSSSAWLLWNKLPERDVEWTKLLQAVNQLYRPEMSVYMPPGPMRAVPAVVAEQHDWNAAFQNIEVLYPTTRRDFLTEVMKRKDFLFLTYQGFSNDEWAYRAQLLEQLGYRRASLPVSGASAEIFTRADRELFVARHQLDGPPLRSRLIEWVRTRLSKPRIVHDSSRLAAALVARASSDGSVKQSIVYASQRGETGYWKLGPAYWDAVYDTRTTSGGVSRDLIYAHPANDSVLVVAFPAIQFSSRLNLVYGIEDSGLAYAEGAPVKLEVYLDADKLAEVTALNTPGWKRLSIDTERAVGRRGALLFLISTPNDRWRHFHFDFATSYR
jgi:hypothetical protein